MFQATNRSMYYVGNLHSDQHKTPQIRFRVQPGQPPDLSPDEVTDALWKQFEDKGRVRFKAALAELVVNKLYYQKKYKELKRKFHKVRSYVQKYDDVLIAEQVSSERLRSQEALLSEELNATQDELGRARVENHQLKEHLEIMILLANASERKESFIIPEEIGRYAFQNETLTGKVVTRITQEKRLWNCLITELQERNHELLDCLLDIKDRRKKGKQVQLVLKVVQETISRQKEFQDGELDSREKMLRELRELVQGQSELLFPTLGEQSEVEQEVSFCWEEECFSLIQMVLTNNTLIGNLLNAQEGSKVSLQELKAENAKLKSTLAGMTKQTNDLELKVKELEMQIEKEREMQQRLKELRSDKLNELDEEVSTFDERLRLKDQLFPKEGLSAKEAMEVCAQKLNFVNFIHDKKHVAQQKIISELSEKVACLLEECRLLECKTEDCEGRIRGLQQRFKDCEDLLRFVGEGADKAFAEVQTVKKQLLQEDEFIYLEFLLKQLAFSLRHHRQ